MSHVTTAFAPVGAETNVGLPVDTDGVYDHDVVALPDGGFVMLWHGTPDPDVTGASGLYLQRYDAQGNAVGDVVTVVATDTNLNTAFSALLPAIALLEDGRLAVTYWNIGNDNDGDQVSQIVLRLIGDDLQTVGAPQVLQPTNGAFDAQVSDITALENGGYAVAWEIGGFFSGGGLIRVQAFDENGPVLAADGLTPAVPKDIGLASSPFGTSSMIGLADGGFAVLYQDYDGVNSDVEYELYLQLFNDHGATIGTPTEIISQPHMFNPEMVQLANGQLVVAWYRTISTFNDLLEFQILEATGELVGEVRSVMGTNGSTYIQDPELEALPEGGFVLSFLSDGGSYVQVYDAAGMAQGDPVLVSDNVTATGTFDHARVTALAGGGLVVTWAHQSQFNAEQGFFQLLEEVDPHAPIQGTDGDDTLTGTPGDDTLAGADGNDALEGGDGNDGVFGQNGDDSLEGGAGDDNMGGGAGADTVNGGDGGDNMGGGAGNDTMSGGTGSDFMGGGQGDDLMSGGDDGDVVNGGAGNDTMAGDGGNDTMGASFGNDSVDGGSGDDTLNGGDGDDTMVGGSGADVFVFNFFKDGDADVITDFEDGFDTVRMVGVENVPGSGLQGKLEALNISDTALGALINYQGHTILLEGVAAADLGLEDFSFL